MKASPLHFAASISYKHDANKIIIDIIKLLIQYKAKVDCIDKFGRTPLYFAAKAGSAEIVKLFLDAGVSPNTEVVRKHKDAPASLPCIHNGSCPNEEIVFEDLDFPKHLGRTPLHEAVSGGHLFCVQLLLDKGAEVNAKDEENLIPLILAIKGTKDCDALTAERYERIVTKLLINDADANYFFDENLQRKHNNSAFFPTKMLDSAICNTPLQYAVNYGSVICVLELLFADAQITTKNKYDESVLHVAAKFGFTDILCLLLEFPDCDEELINSPDNRLRTPSHVAARNGIVDCLMMLLNNGGNLLAVDSVNLTVLDTIFIFFRQPTDFLLNFFNSKIKFIFTPREMCKRKISIDLSSLLQKNMKQQTALISHLSEHSRLLQHPLVETFVVCKWKKIRPIILFLHVVNTFFIITLSVFIFLQVYQCNLPYKIKKPLSYFLILFAILILLKCIIELKSLGRLRYKKIEPWLKTVFPLYSIALVVFTWIVNETCDNAARFNSLNHLSSIVILFAWIHIMFTLTRFYEYGFYGDMFLIVLSNVGKVLSSLFCLIIGFVLFFSINFRNDKLFGNPFFSFIKTIVMMTGEFDYNDLFTDEHDKIELYTTRIIFVLFMLMMTIVLMNIMSGLAITDIQ
ncbi:transient receptor potential channel pyrexia-like isoform X2 [Lycorma delicatula]